MVKLFDKVSGTSTSFTATGITDSSASWTVDEFKDWFVTFDGTEYKITSNTTDTLVFDNAIVANNTYEIAFIGRTFLTEMESDMSNATKVPDALISKKYEQVNIDLSNKVFAYLKKLYTSSFDPLTKILNLEILQQSYAYNLLGKIYQDLMIDQESFEGFKGYNMYEKSYNDGIRDSLSLLQIDLNSDGEANANEKAYAVSNVTYLNR